ncbi:hypothetical protein BS50DRAFT_585862 [Corynespora cassiicola Philippines]|uniref:AB hydrolase-1 domain-containing protein n=1 Tax=Corynespora cassiicola Philippines TaxID=1448308 RepID=A0A2T2NYE8_CORCC|nr:hypothetical protein BS50DRAFT_585862 [Corynespora cassiicola Philippines]
MGALEFICNQRFHRSYTLPPNPSTGRTTPHRFSYADFGDPNSDAVVLLCGGLMSTRLNYLDLDQQAKAHSVRILHPDRPGIGGSEAIARDERIDLWLEMLPSLLAHLSIPHVSFASHSGGDIYLLNALLALPHLLHPSRPYVCMFAPWVHSSHSGVTLMRALDFLPTAAIGKLAPAAQLVAPLAEVGGGLVRVSLSRAGAFSSPSPSSRARVGGDEAAGEDSAGEHLDLDWHDAHAVDELNRHIASFRLAEAMDGMSADAQLFLKRPASLSWSSRSVAWTDMDEISALLCKMIGEEEEGGPRGGRGRREWSIDAFHAEHDNMVGERGRRWFDGCWQQQQQQQQQQHRSASSDGPSISPHAEAQPNRSGYQYRSEIVKGSDHNFLMQPEFGASDVWLRRVREACPTPGVSSEA